MELFFYDEIVYGHVPSQINGSVEKILALACPLPERLRGDEVLALRRAKEKAVDPYPSMSDLIPSLRVWADIVESAIRE